MECFKNYKDAAEHQLREWAEGRPWHNPWAPDGSYGESRKEGECCPDFSCCAPENLWAKERRYAFVAANDENRYAMLLGGLSELLAGENVYVAGKEPPDEH